MNAGLLQEPSLSGAVVIGVMIVAPLVLRIMGMATHVVTDVATAFAMGFLLTLPLVQGIKPEAIQQIMIRASAHLPDLMAPLVIISIFLTLTSYRLSITRQEAV